jgi:hypothetical protein
MDPVCRKIRPDVQANIFRTSIRIVKNTTVYLHNYATPPPGVFGKGVAGDSDALLIALPDVHLPVVLAARKHTPASVFRDGWDGWRAILPPIPGMP